MRKSPAILAVLLGGAVFAAALSGRWRGDSEGDAGTRSPHMASWFVTYDRPMAPPGALKQVITPDHGTILKVTGAIVGVELPDRSEIGTYAAPLAAAEAESLKKLAAAAIDEATAMKGMTVPRGTRFLAFAIGRTGEDVDASANFPLSQSLPPAVRRFDDAMLELAKKSLDHRRTTLQGEAACEPPAVTPQENPVIKLTLRNTGSKPIRIHNPAAASADDRVGLQIMVEKDVPPDKEDDGSSKLVQLTRADVSQETTRPARGGAQATSQLAPGEEIILILKPQRRMYLGAGAWRAWVTYRSATDGMPEEMAVEGSLRIPAGKLAVKSKR